MADTIVITSGANSSPPANTIIATDDAGAAGQVQIMKIAISADGSAVPIPADAVYGLVVDVTRLPALVAGNANIGDVDVASVPAPLNVVGGGVEAAALRVTIANNSTGVLSVDDNGAALTVDGSVSITGAIPAGTNNIGDVDVITLPALVAGTALVGKVSIDQVTANANEVVVKSAIPAGTNNIGDVDVLTLPGIAGTVADDGVDSGNPIKVGGKAIPMNNTNPGQVVANDRIDFIGDLNRRQYVNDVHPNFWYVLEGYAAAQTNNALKAAPGAGLSLYVTDVVLSTDTLMNILLVEDTAGTPITRLGPIYLSGTGGAAIHFRTPLKLTANKDLGFSSSAAGNHTVDVHGFIAP